MTAVRDKARCWAETGACSAIAACPLLTVRQSTAWRCQATAFCFSALLMQVRIALRSCSNWSTLLTSQGCTLGRPSRPFQTGGAAAGAAAADGGVAAAADGVAAGLGAGAGDGADDGFEVAIGGTPGPAAAAADAGGFAGGCDAGGPSSQPRRRLPAGPAPPAASPGGPFAAAPAMLPGPGDGVLAAERP